MLDDIDRGGCDRVAEHMCNLAASVGVAMRCLFTADSALGCGLSVFYTLLYWRWGQHLSVNMSWNIVSLAVVFPVSQGISMSFKRREQALGEFGNLLGNLRALWGALHSWKVKGEADGEWVRVIEKFEDTEATEHKMRELFEELLTGMITYFDVPRWGRARHSIGCCGREEGQQLQEITHEQKLCVDSSIARAQRLVQELKALGLSGGETHRLDQYLSKINIAFERLVCIKEYRTPQAFRAFARVYILLFGLMYGPYYIHLAKGDSEEEDNITLALAFACVVQLAISGLFTGAAFSIRASKLLALAGDLQALYLKCLRNKHLLLIRSGLCCAVMVDLEDPFADAEQGGKRGYVDRVNGGSQPRPR